MKSLIVAPHSDDAILCLGGRMLACQEDFEVLNVFSTCAFTIIPNLKDSKKITERNNEEEMAALGSVGVDVEFMHLPEVLLRGYKKWCAQPNNKRDSPIKEKTRKRLLRESDRRKFYFPLGIGGHTDHLLLNDLAIALYKAGFFKGKELLFYEDIPYALDEKAETRVSRVQNKIRKSLEQQCLDISAYIDAKTDLVCLYKTQYDREYALKIKGYAGKLSGNGFLERCWKVPD